MHGSAIFGNYWPTESVLHQLDPRAKLVGLLFAMVAVFCAKGFAALAVAAVFVSGFFALAHIPLRQAFRSIAPLLFIVVLTALLNMFFVQGGAEYVSVGPIHITAHGLYSAAFLSCRLTLLLLMGSLLTLTTSTLDITDATEVLLSPLARIGVPAHEFALVLGIALRFLPQFVGEARQIRAAQQSRGAHEGQGVRGWIATMLSLLVPLFASAFRHAETLSAGMDARCYHGGAGRTRLSPLQLSTNDMRALAVLAAMLCAVLATNMLVG